MTLSLDGLTPYEPQKMYLTRHTRDCEEQGYGLTVKSDSRKTDFQIQTYAADDGNLYAAIVRNSGAEWETDVFFTFPNHPYLSGSLDDISVYSFTDLLGHSGFTLNYTALLTGTYAGTVVDYYYLEDDGTLYLLARAKCEQGALDIQMDLNDDGERELCAASGASAQVIFRRDGQLFDADIRSLLESAWPELNFWNGADWDYEYRV